MKKYLMPILYWTVPGFIVWMTLSILNARMYENGLRDGKFAPDADTISIPIFSFSVACFFAMVATTVLIFALSRLMKRLNKAHYVSLTISLMILIGTGAYIAFERNGRQNNLQVISDDVAEDITKVGKTLEYHVPYNFNLDDATCSVIWLPMKEFEQIQKNFTDAPEWGPFSGQTEPIWKDCFRNVSGFKFYEASKLEEYIKTTIVIGLDPARQLLIHAYSSKLLPHSEAERNRPEN